MNSDVLLGDFKTNDSINWSEKVRHLDKTIRDEIGMESDIEPQHILIKVQTKSAESIEPAFIVGEDDIFLDLFVLSSPNGGIISTAVLKDNIQSVGVIGGVSPDNGNDKSDDNPLIVDDIEGLYQ